MNTTVEAAVTHFSNIPPIEEQPSMSYAFSQEEADQITACLKKLINNGTVKADTLLFGVQKGQTWSRADGTPEHETCSTCGQPVGFKLLFDQFPDKDKSFSPPFNLYGMQVTTCCGAITTRQAILDEREALRKAHEKLDAASGGPAFTPEEAAELDEE